MSRSFVVSITPCLKIFPGLFRPSWAWRFKISRLVDRTEERSCMPNPIVEDIYLHHPGLTKSRNASWLTSSSISSIVSNLTKFIVFDFLKYSKRYLNVKKFQITYKSLTQKIDAVLTWFPYLLQKQKNFVIIMESSIRLKCQIEV